MKYFSLFTGIGGFELGIEHAHETINKCEVRTKQAHGGHMPFDCRDNVEKPICVGYSEIDKYAIQIYQSHFPEHKNYGDITKINEKELPDFDLLVGGFPCQSFSIAGKRKGFADTRGTLFFDIARILQRKRPRLLLLENVKGLLSHDNGDTFKTIIATLTELGYDLQWQVLNSKNFGVPQNRERVLIVGHLRGTPRPEVFPITGDGDETNGGICANAITASYWKGHDNHGARTQIAYTPKEQGGKVEQAGKINEGQSGRIYSPTGLSPTLNTMTGGGLKEPKIIEGMRIRRLTPTECERLQGFPDGWTLGVSDTQRYKTLGNAVTTNVIRFVCERIFATI